MQLSWVVYRYDCNSKKIVHYDVLNGRDEFLRKIASRASSFEEFENELKGEMMRRYWSKFEHEITVSCYPIDFNPDSSVKIDIYEQLKLNWKQFAEYCWNGARMNGKVH